MEKNLRRRIAEFEKAENALKVAEKNLNAAVDRTHWTDWPTSKIQGFIDLMPKGYKGTRRMYEVILRKTSPTSSPRKC